jgi:hypothetical protein
MAIMLPWSIDRRSGDQRIIGAPSDREGDNAVFLADGRIVDEMAEASAGRVLDRMKRFGD